MNPNKLIVFSAPSGSGKTTLVKHLLQSGLPLEFSISATSRNKRDKEVNGKDYYFLSPEAFKNKINNGDFIEWEEVYHDTFYGTLKSELNRIWEQDKSVIFDVDVVGGINIKKQFPEQTLAVFVKAPSIEVMENRLKYRATESEEKIAERIAKAKFEMDFSHNFDMVLVNDKLEVAKKEAVKIVQEFLD